MEIRLIIHPSELVFQLIKEFVLFDLVSMFLGKETFLLLINLGCNPQTTYLQLLNIL